MQNNFDIRHMMRFAGIQECDDDETILEKFSILFTKVLNTTGGIRMDDYSWKFSYIDGGDKTKFEKIGPDGVVASLEMDSDTFEYTGTNLEDPDIQKILHFMALGIFFGE